MRVIGVQTTDSDAMARSIRAGRRIELHDVGLFSDGTAVTAADVVNAFELNMADATYGAFLSFIDAVAEKDETTVTFTLKSGATVKWGSSEDSDRKAEVLAVLLRLKAKMYDVSVPGTPVTK